MRLIGDAAVAVFFAYDKDRARRADLPDLSLAAGGEAWDRLQQRAVSLEGGEHPVRPFHWEIEFPEVFARDNPGFDAIVGNPPFAGKNTTIAGNREHYLEWLQHLHTGAHGNADLVAHFFRRAFGMIRDGGSFGLIATNTIGQGDTRETGLCAIIASGGAITHAVKRLKWPGEAAVVVSVVHLVKGEAEWPTLDDRPVRRVSAYLVEGDLDESPPVLSENAEISFKGSELHGVGFMFDDDGAEKAICEPLSKAEEVIAVRPSSAERIKPFFSGEDFNNSVTFESSRLVFDLGDLELDEARDRFPELLAIAEQWVKPIREKDNRPARKERWWRFGERASGLYSAIRSKEQVLCTLFTSPHMNFALIDGDRIFANAMVVTTLDSCASFASLQSRAHEVWARFFSSSMKDDLRYAPSDCFETFPLPPGYDSAPALEAAGEAYHAHRAAMMVTTNKGMTKTYNRFHDPHDKAADIVTLRRLHAAMDDAVLRAYGWDDLAGRAAGGDAPRFLTEDDEDDHKYQKRLFWPAPFRDELLARLLKLNEERAAAEKAGN